jgi:hypothetical protein
MSRSAARITPPDEPFYGWRYIKKALPDGSVDLVEVPLTLEDVLHPQEDDVIPDQEFQHADAVYLESVFKDRIQRLPGGLLLGDRLVNWGVPGIRDHSPDLAVFRDVTNPPRRNFGTLRLRASGGRCVLVVEIVSPHTRVNDVVHKLREYHRVGVLLYYVIDQRTEDGPRSLVGYRYTKARYVKMRPDRQGRLLLKPLGVRLAVENDRAVCYDADTGERIRGYDELAERVRELEAEQRRARGE